MKVVIAGGGWSGCAAAVAARKSGAEVVLHERTDMLLGTGLVGGIMRNNGRFTATEEAIAMGGGDLFTLIDRQSRHTGVEFPGHHHANLYDIAKTPMAVTRYLESLGIRIEYESRIHSVKMDERRILSVLNDRGVECCGDVFIDTTGTAGPQANCTRHGNGCAMCILRCPSFGGRISLTGLCGIEEVQGRKDDGQVGAMSGSCKLYKESLSPEIQEMLEATGVAVIPIPENLIENHLDLKACQQYALPAFMKNIVLLDTGHAKLMSPFFDLHKLHQIPGFENARYEDPYAGGRGNSMRYFAMAPRSNALQVAGIDNLFCAGEKAGLLVGHTEAIVTGTLAGYNAVQRTLGNRLLELPRSLAIGEGIAYVREQMQTEKGLGLKYTFSGSVLFDRMVALGLYTTDISAIGERVRRLGLKDVYAGPQPSQS